MTEQKKIVKNTSKAGSGNYGYNYASLADIAEQGFEIPKMRVRPVFNPNGEFVADYLEFFDGKEWHLGSRIIDAELKGMNPMQSRGSAETYARRYTTLMALQLAGQDDKEVENDGVKRKTSQPAQKQSFKSDPRLNFDTIRETCAGIDDLESLEAYYKELMELGPSEGAKPYINKIINEAKGRLK
jgi:hypothetical protein